ncbi:MAG: hypothetical protein Q8Q01_00385 [archaeon]|nr:hypothetical protein [archaeon]
MASYKQLSRFQSILNEDSFTYISSIQIIRQMSQLIRSLKHTIPPGGRDFAKQYLLNFEKFISVINYEKINQLETGINLCLSTVRFVSDILNQRREQQLPSGRLRVMEKEYLYSLGKILSGLRIAFRVDIKTFSPPKDVALRYFFDKKEGVGRNYAFNKIGGDSPDKVLPSLSIENIYLAISLLELHRDTKNIGSWTIFGTTATPIRIIASERLIGKKRIFAIFKAEGHTKQKSGYLILTKESTPQNTPFEEL